MYKLFYNIVKSSFSILGYKLFMSLHDDLDSILRINK